MVLRADAPVFVPSCPVSSGVAKGASERRSIDYDGGNSELKAKGNNVVDENSGGNLKSLTKITM